MIGLSNAFGMVPPVYAVQVWLAETLGIGSDAIRLLLIFVFGNLLLPGLILYLLPRLSSSVASPTHRRINAGQFAGAFVPIGASIWLAHYGFHLGIGGAAIIPVFHSFLIDHGVMIFGAQPNWSMSFLMPQNWIFPLQVFSLLVGFAGSLYVLSRTAMHRQKDPAIAFRELLPWAIVIVILAILSLSIFNLPMEMRGTRMLGL
jgi:hypothetical protein